MLCWYNSEIKACISVKEGGVKEEHLCQLAEGTAIGKRLKDTEVCLVPHCWFAIGAQPEALGERFGGTDNGRLRAFTAFLNRSECSKISLRKKFSKRKFAFTFTADLLKGVASAQQADPPLVEEFRYDDGSYTVLQAMHDALSDTLQGREANSAVVAALIKLVGKGFGSVSSANCSARLGALRAASMASSSSSPVVDNVVRFEDSLAAANKIKHHIINQLWAEAQIAKAAAQGGPRAAVAAKASHFDDLTNAARRFCDYVVSRATFEGHVLWL